MDRHPESEADRLFSPQRPSDGQSTPSWTRIGLLALLALGLVILTFLVILLIRGM